MTASVDDADLGKAGLAGDFDVRGYDLRHLLRSEGVEIEPVLDGERDRVVGDGRPAVAEAPRSRVGRGVAPTVRRVRADGRLALPVS